MGRFYLGVILGIILNVTGAAPVGWPGAVTAVAQESPATEKSATALISEGYDALSRGDAQTALERLQAGVTKNPEQKEGWLLLGDALSLLGKLEEAEKAYVRARDLAGNDPAMLSQIEMRRSAIAPVDARFLNEYGVSIAPALLTEINRNLHILGFRPRQKYRITGKRTIYTDRNAVGFACKLSVKAPNNDRHDIGEVETSVIEAVAVFPVLFVKDETKLASCQSENFSNVNKRVYLFPNVELVSEEKKQTPQYTNTIKSAEESIALWQDNSGTPHIRTSRSVNIVDGATRNSARDRHYAFQYVALPDDGKAWKAPFVLVRSLNQWGDGSGREKYELAGVDELLGMPFYLFGAGMLSESTPPAMPEPPRVPGKFSRTDTANGAVITYDSGWTEGVRVVTTLDIQRAD